MKRVCSHQDYGVIYSLPMDPWPLRYRHKRWDDMAASYEQALGRDRGNGSHVQKKRISGTPLPSTHIHSLAPLREGRNKVALAG
jgi:hypothetical protein